MNVGMVVANGNVFNYAPLAEANGNFDSVYAENISGMYAPLAEERGNSINPDNFYREIEKMAAASAEEIAEEKGKFADMYVQSAANNCRLIPYSDREELITNPKSYMEITKRSSQKQCEAIEGKGYICVPIQGGEFPQFMSKVKEDLESGLSLTEALENRVNEYKEKNHTIGIANNNSDMFYINPENGDVEAVFFKARVTLTADYEAHFTDEDAALELADDLATFLRYAAFKKEGDNPQRAEQLMSYLQKKQAYANYDRFIFDLDGDESVDNTKMSNQIIADLIAAGVLKDEESEEEKEAVDGLMEAIRVHEEELREKRIDLEESERAAREIWEIVGDKVKAV